MQIGRTQQIVEQQRRIAAKLEKAAGQVLQPASSPPVLLQALRMAFIVDVNVTHPTHGPHLVITLVHRNPDDPGDFLIDEANREIVAYPADMSDVEDYIPLIEGYSYPFIMNRPLVNAWIDGGIWVVGFGNYARYRW